MRIGDQIRHRLRVEPPGAPRGEGGVETLRGRADERGAHRLAAERLDDVPDLPRRDALQIALGERAEKRLLMALIPREGRRREAAGPVARDREHEATHARHERARAGAVAHAAPLVRPLVRPGAEELRELAGEGFLHDGLHELAKGGGIGTEG